MGTQMQTEMLPALGEQLGMTGEELNGFLGQNFPATAQALQTLPEAMERFGGLVGTFENNLDNYETIKPVAFSPIIWTLLIGGLVTLGAFGLAWWMRPKKLTSADIPRIVETAESKEKVNI